MTSRFAVATSLVAVALLIAGCAESGVPDTAPTAASPLDTPSSAPGDPVMAPDPGDVVTGLVAPWSMVAAGPSVLVSERDTGRIYEITPSRDIRAMHTVEGVRFGGEGGLLGLALDPAGGDLFVYSTGDAGNRVQRFAVDGDPGDLTLGAPETVIDELPAARTHNAGRIAFGPDGMLYVPVGDAGSRDAAQDPDTLHGTVLRLTPTGGIPDDNPFPASPVYSYGHRNVQGLAWTADGRMFASEFGQDTWDELNLIEAGGNYGWPVVEGIGGDDRFIDPVQVWTPDEASPSGLTVIGDTLYIANLRGERVRAIPADDLSSSRDLLVGEFGRLRDVIVAPDGLVWIATSNTSRGTPRDGDDRIVALDPDSLAR